MQVLFGWQYAAPAAMISIIVVGISERAPTLRTSFNAASCCLSAFMSAVPGFVLGWHHLQPQEFGRLSLLVFLGGVAYISTNVLTVAGVVAIYQNVSLRSVIDDYVRHSGPAFGIMAFIAASPSSSGWCVRSSSCCWPARSFALALYQRYAYRSVVATRDAETDALTGLRQPPGISDRPPRDAGAGASTRIPVTLA